MHRVMPIVLASVVAMTLPQQVNGATNRAGAITKGSVRGRGGVSLRGRV